MLKRKNITSIYIFCQIFGVLIAMFPNEILTPKDSLIPIIFYHLFGVVFFILGYLLPAIKINPQKKWSVEIKVPFFFVLISVALSIFGIAVSYLQITAFTSMSAYTTLLVNADEATRDIRGNGAHSENGGISGIFKMFAYAPLAIFLMALSLKHFLLVQNKFERSRLNFVIYFSLLCSFLKAFLWLDRLTIGAIILPFFYIVLNKKFSLKEYLFIFLGAIAILMGANLISSNRIAGYSLIDFIVLYFKLGLVNFDLMVKTLHGHTYGFSTFAAPLNFIFRFFNSEIIFNSRYEIEWNDAQYMNSYLHQDFGYFSLLVYFFIGWVMKNHDHFTHTKNPYHICIYFISLFALVSFWVVPIINAIEYWLMLIIAMMCTTLCIKNSTYAKV